MGLASSDRLPRHGLGHGEWRIVILTALPGSLPVPAVVRTTGCTSLEPLSIRVIPPATTPAQSLNQAATT